MLNVKQTLKNLHKKFPTLGLDELFEVLDCYVEEYTIKDWEPNKIWYDYKIDTMPLKTNGIEINNDSISCSTSNKIDRKYDGNTTTTAEPGSIQLTTNPCLCGMGTPN